MFAPRTPVPRWAFALLAFVSASLILLLLLPIVIDWREDRAEDAMRRELGTARRLVDRLHTVLSRDALNDRGFLLTGDSTYLRRMDELVDEQNEVIARLDSLAPSISSKAESAMEALESTLGSWQLNRRRALHDPSAAARTTAFPLLASSLSASLYATGRFVAAVDEEATRRMESREARQRIWTVVISGLALLALVSVAVLVWLGRYLHKLSRRLRRAIDARDEVLTMVSHDLRTPLQTVVAACDLLEQRSEEEQRRFVDSARVAADEMSRLVDDLLDAEMIERGKLTLDRTAVDVAPLLEDVVEAVDVLVATEDLELRRETSTHLPAIHADPYRVKQVFFNLISNAARVTEAGGTITITAEADSRVVRFSVEDTGPGITVERLGTLFERPGNGEEDVEHGLGLAIARGIVEAHGGEIWADSVQGVGSVFAFSVPCVNGPSGTSGRE